MVFIPETSKSTSKSLYISPEEVSDHLIKYNITHAVVFYDIYDNINKLQKLVPNIKIYGLQYINNPNITLDIGKDLLYGVKIHSHRVSEDNKYGLDYNSISATKILDKLSENSLCYYHTQNPSSYTQYQATPIAIANLAIEYPWLKFIIGHSGSFGLYVIKPKEIDYDLSSLEEIKKYNLFLKLNVFSSGVISSAVAFSSILKNIFLDTSTYVKYKAEILTNSTKWSVGSDITFGSGNMNNFDYQLNNFSKITGQDKEEISNRGIAYLENSLGINKFKKSKDKNVNNVCWDTLDWEDDTLK